jgi:hypothetical protein
MILMLLAASVSSAQNFQWNWHDSKYLTAEQSLRNANVTTVERESLARVLADQLRPMVADADIASENQLQEAALDTRIEKLDLKGDGSPEVIAQAVPGCIPTGNCSLWIFQRITHGYRLILDGFGQTFTVQHTRTNAFSDIVVEMHG